jgi:DNA-binding CsgD family transcriptional regulator
MLVPAAVPDEPGQLAAQAREAIRLAYALALHDTVLPTLTAIARGDLDHRCDQVRRRCAQDADSIRRLLQAEPGEISSLDEVLTQVASAAEALGLRVPYRRTRAHAVADGTSPRRPELSPRERAVLQAYASGMTLRAAARHVGIQPETARTYLLRVKAKYHDVGRPAYTKLELAERVWEDGAAAAPG